MMISLCRLKYAIAYILFIITIGSACTSSVKKSKKINISFYYWKQQYALSDKEKEMLDRLQVKTLYVKFFDILWQNNQTKPVADIAFTHSPEHSIIPCVFITNEVMLHQEEGVEIDSLAKHIYDRVIALTRHYHITSVSELQLDCDWTSTTRAKFFQLLNSLRKISQYPISSTLRLHQLKYSDNMGIPPVTEVSLMCYNMSSPQNYDIENSIYDFSELKKYTDRAESYPLGIRLAMPLYAWTCIFRQGHFQGFLNEVRKSDLDTVSYLKNIKKNRYKCEKTTKFRETILLKGDELRVEELAPQQVQEGIAYMTQQIPSDTLNVIFYHLDENILKYYEKNLLSNLPSSH